MAQKIGNYLFILSVSLSLYGQGIVELSIVSMNNQPLQSAAVNIPFTIVVNVKNIEGAIDVPKLQGLDSLEILNQNQQFSTRIMNGVTQHERKFIYQVRARHAGTITIGPATITMPTPLSSSTITLPIEAQNVSSRSDQDVSFEFIPAKTTVYIGEELPFIERFSYNKQGLKIRELEEPELKNATVIIDQNATTRNSNINGKAYTIIEIKGSLYPKSEGKMVIPSLLAKYSISDHFFGFFSGFEHIDSVYSNDVTITVLPLPPYNKSVQGIGSFTALNASLSKSEITQDEGVALTFELKGMGNFESVKGIELSLPQELKFYESKADIEGNDTKKFEYIIQPMSEGDYHIAAQSFTYFDPKKKKYFTLRSKPLQLKVLPAHQKVLNTMPQEQPNIEISNRTEPEQKHSFATSSIKPLPWLIFMLLCILPFVYVCISKLKYYANKRSRSRIFKEAQKKLRKMPLAESYKIIEQAFRNYLQKNFITQDDITILMKQWNLDVEQWNSFLNKVFNHSPYSGQVQEIEENNLRREMNHWFDLFIKKSKRIFFFLLVVFVVHVQAQSVAQDISVLRSIQDATWGSDIKRIDQTVDQIKENAKVTAIPRFSPIVTTLYYALLMIPLLVWQLLFIMVLWFFIFSFGFIKKRYSIILALVLFFIACSIGAIAYIRQSKWAIIDKQNAMLYIGPDERYPIKGELHFLDEVQLKRKLQNWFYVSTTIGTGWIHQNDIELYR